LRMSPGQISVNGVVMSADQVKAMAASGNAASQPNQNQSERMNRLRALTYDRRPSAILKAWSEPPKTEEETKAEEKKAQEKAEAEKNNTAPENAAAIPAASSPATAIVQPATGVTGTLTITAPAAAVSPPLASAPATAIVAPPATSAATPAASSTPVATPARATPNVKAAPPAAKTPAAKAVTTPAATAAAAAAQAAQTEQQKAEAAKKEAETKKLEAELAELQRHVTLSHWPEVKAYFAGIPAEEGKEGYAQMLRSLASPPGQSSGDRKLHIPGVGTADEENVFELNDVFGLATACPHKIDKDLVRMLAPVLRRANQSGTVLTEIVARFKLEADKPEKEAVLNRRRCAQLLDATGLILELKPFLPTLDEAITAKDAEGINLLARYQLALHQKDRKPILLEEAWKILQASLALTEAEKQDQEETLKLAVDLAPKLKKEVGEAWLEQSFTEQTQRGITILAKIGSLASTSLESQPQAPDSRLQTLKLQKTAAEALLRASPERAKEWHETLALLAQAWQREAEFSRAAAASTSIVPRMQRDSWGNFYYMNSDGEMEMGYRQQYQGNAQPISVADILEVAPSDAWLSSVDSAIQPRFQAIFAALYLKVAEEDRAFPYIERLATTHPDLAKDLAHEHIRLWTTSHDPNASRRYSNPYIFMYGFERKAESIPLTRSKQERNLTELAALVKRLRALPLKDLDESLFINAFTNCHSSAEVYDLEAIDRVFGSVDSLKPKAIAELVQKMRNNLAGQWRMPAEQEQKKTRRKQKDIAVEVLRGYGVANKLLADAIQKQPEDWRLSLAQSCLALDQISFQNELQPDSNFSHRRIAIIDSFKHAADLYAKQLATLPEEEQSTLAYEHWFYAGLGASDLGRIDHKSISDDRQPPLIHAALQALPGAAAQKHQDMFANSLFTRMSALKPTVKFRYLESGFKIVGDHKQAREARMLYDYYKDLVTEIKLVTRVDGSPSVGAGESFGLFIELYHTREIERESGGFGRYLQNQQGNMFFSYNYGRPLENYRDKFEESVRAALAENFDVLSITFQAEDVTSRAAPEFGWRLMPYAYVLLKARGPQIDKLPSLKMDLDFLDTSGYVVLPITSPALPIDASKVASDGRPCENLKITQTLDERQAANGKLVLEVKATGQGLVPKLENLVDPKFSEFTIADTEDQGLSISKFDPDSSEPAVLSERTWLITLAGRKDLAEKPKTFEFPEAKLDDAESTFQRYNDADLAMVERVVSLEQQYGAVRRPWLWGLVALVPLGLAAIFGVKMLSRRGQPEEESRFKVPQTITPFSVLALLKNIAERDGLATDERQELTASIADLEHHYFAATNGNGATMKPDLRGVAETWVRRAR
jgi:chemotaxis protein histidine kinase CheA